MCNLIFGPENGYTMTMNVVVVVVALLGFQILDSLRLCRFSFSADRNETFYLSHCYSIAWDRL